MYSRVSFARQLCVAILLLASLLDAGWASSRRGLMSNEAALSDDFPFETAFWGVRETVTCDPTVPAPCGPGWFCDAKARSGAASCTRCWHACIACASSLVNLTSNPALQHSCKSCGCPQNTTAGAAAAHAAAGALPLGNKWPDKSQRCGIVTEASNDTIPYYDCGTVGYCSKSTGRCASCYDLVLDNDTWFGNGEQACGFMSRQHYARYGLPFDASSPARHLWVVDALVESASFFYTNLGYNNMEAALAARGAGPWSVASNTSDLRLLLEQAAMPDLPEAQVKHIFTQSDVDGDGVVRPEEWVRAMVTTRDRYSVMCLPDAVAQVLGNAWPSCSCTYISASSAAAAGKLSEQAAQVLVAQASQAEVQLSPESQELVRNLTGEYNVSSVRYNINKTVACPAGYRCSRYGFLHLTPQLARRGISVLNGICMPCLVGEYCKNGTTELGTEGVSMCLAQVGGANLEGLINGSLAASNATQGYLDANRQQIQDILNQIANATNNTAALGGGSNITQAADHLLDLLKHELAQLAGAQQPQGRTPPSAHGGLPLLTPDMLHALEQQLGLAGVTGSNLTYLWNKTMVETGLLHNPAGITNTSLWSNITTNGTAANTAVQQLLDAYTKESMGGRHLYQSLSTCNNAKPCPSGNFCPKPDQLVFCQPGNFCALGSVGPSTCNVTRILNSNPSLALQRDPELLLQGLNDRALPIEGNTCPASSNDPYMGCMPGSYCPNTTLMLPCPIGHWCPAHSTAPKRCSALMACRKEGMSWPHMAWWAVCLLIMALASLPVLLMLSETTLKRKQAAQRAEQKQLASLAALGFMELANPSATAQPLETQRAANGACPKANVKALPFQDDERAGLLGAQPATSSKATDALPAPPVPGSVADAGGSGAARKLAPGQHAQGIDGEVWPRVSVHYKGLGLQLHGVKGPSGCVLKNVTGDFACSAMHAVMGPSGSGKSSFLAALTGRAPYAKVSGSVGMTLWQHAGMPGSSCNPEQVKLITGWVPQDDLLHDTLSVHENLCYSARLRLPRGTSAEDRFTVIQQVLRLVGLSHVAHSIVGSVEKRGISGGQRKRASIALELVTRPSLLFLDEPTSGLDAATSSDVLGALKTMSQRGMCVAMVIHQPRFAIFEMFDTVLLLGAGGRTVYQGPSTLVLSYFTDGLLGFKLPANENPADYFLDVMTGVSPREGDEDFVPRELYDLWEQLGPQWVRAHLAVQHEQQQQRQLAGTLTSAEGSGQEGQGVPCPTIADADAVLVWLRGGDSIFLPSKAFRQFATLKRITASLHGSSAASSARHDSSFGATAAMAAQPPTFPFSATHRLGPCGWSGPVAGAGHLAWLQEAIHEVDEEQDNEEASQEPVEGYDALAATAGHGAAEPSPFDRASSLPRSASLGRPEGSLSRSGSITRRDGSQLVSQAAQVRMIIAASLEPRAARSPRAGPPSLPKSPCAPDGATPHGSATSAADSIPALVPAGGRSLQSDSKTSQHIHLEEGAREHGVPAPLSVHTLPATDTFQGPLTSRVRSTFTYQGAQRETTVCTMQAARAYTLPWRPRDMQVIVDRFNELDKDGDGSLSLVEFSGLFTSLRTSRMVSPEVYEALVARLLIDFNVKGTQPITRSQFLAAVKTRLILADLAGQGTLPSDGPGTQGGALLQLQLDEQRQQMLRMVLDQMFAVPASSKGALSLPGLPLAGSPSPGKLGSPQHQDVEAGTQAPGKLPARTEDEAETAGLLGKAEQGDKEGGWPKVDWRQWWAEQRSWWAEVWASLVGQPYGGRQLSPVWGQAWVVLQRSAAKTLNSAREVLLLDLAVLALAAMVLGAVQGHAQSITKLPPQFAMTTTAFAMFCTIAGLRSFSGEQLMYVLREAPGGLTTLAYLAGRMTWDVIVMPLYPMVFLSCLYAVTAFDTPWGTYYGILTQVAWYSTGMGYAVAASMAAANAMTAAALASLLFGAQLNGINPSLATIRANGLWVLQALISVGYARWALEALVVHTLLPATHSTSLVTVGALSRLGYCGVDALPTMDPSVNVTVGNLTLSWSELIAGQMQASDLESIYIESQLAGDSKQRRSARLLWSVYKNPSVLTNVCKPYLTADAIAIMMWGLFFRMLTHLLLWRKTQEQIKYHKQNSTAAVANKSA